MRVFGRLPQSDSFPDSGPNKKREGPKVKKGDGKGFGVKERGKNILHSNILAYKKNHDRIQIAIRGSSMAERLSVKEDVEGSSPSRGALLDSLDPFSGKRA